MKFVLLISLFCIIASAYALEVVSPQYYAKYENYTVYKVHPRTDSHLAALNSLPKALFGHVDFWTDVRGTNVSVDIMVSSARKRLFLNILKKFNLQSDIMVENVAESMRQQTAQSSEVNSNDDFNYAKYHSLEDIQNWIDSMAAQFNQYVTVINFGQSFENRQIKGFKISVPSGSQKKALWFDAGIHAREWISPATLIYMANALLTKYGSDATVTEVLDTFDVYILPVFNVDGYVYTRTTDRMWRKTRSKSKKSPCYGADPNRNWDANWSGPGASGSPCSDTYYGDSVFSEVEVKQVADYLTSLKGTLVGYWNIHSYSQLWMTPYGYKTDKPADFTLQDNGSVAAINALKALYGTQYAHGNIASAIYVASGSSVDWTYDALGVIFSFAVELRDTGRYGFLLPENQIVPSGLETFEALKASAIYIKNNLPQ